MPAGFVIDETTEFGARAARRLREETVAWMTTVSPSGAPVPSPVWFLWDGAGGVLMYSVPGVRTRNIERNPRVTLHFDGNGRGGDIVVFTATAVIDEAVPAAAENAEYRQKYAPGIDRLGGAEAFSSKYSVPVRVRLEKLRGH